MNYLYIETLSGISGDMTVGALLDMGADQDKLDKALSTIKAEGFEIAISQVKKSGLACTDFDVKLDQDHDGHDQDMEYLYGHLHSHESIEASGHHHSHGEEHHGHHHSHGKSNHDHNHGHSHSHRGMAEINTILDGVDMSAGARALTDRIFAILAQAESKAHGVPVDQVHFHEVGAIDSIVDIVAAAVCLDDLMTRYQVAEVIVPKLYEGQGTVRCQHGILPVPVPAVANIAADYGIPMEIINVNGELVTPTGAAIVAAMRGSASMPATFEIKAIGYGAGKRDYGLAGFVRTMIISGE